MWFTPRRRNEETGLTPRRDWETGLGLAPMMFDMLRYPEQWLGDFSFVPQIDLQDTKEAYQVTAELPGIDPNNVEISVKDGVLELKGEKKEEKEAGESEYGLKERRYGAFHRRIPLERDIKEDQVKAKYKDGVLRIELPKTETGGSKSIPIETEQGE